MKKTITQNSIRPFLILIIGLLSWSCILGQETSWERGFIRKNLHNSYDSIVWGACTYYCKYTIYNRSSFDYALMDVFDKWYKKDGYKIFDKWNKRQLLTKNDSLYLPVVKARFWDSIVGEEGKAPNVYAGTQFLPPSDSNNAKFQLTMNNGLIAIQKFYRDQPLTHQDTLNLIDWQGAILTVHRIAGFMPKSLPGNTYNNWGNKLSDPPFSSILGSKIPNLFLYKPEFFMAQDSFLINDPSAFYDRSKVYKPGAEKQIMGELRWLKQWHVPNGSYPYLKNKLADTGYADTDSMTSLNNVLKRNKKPMLVQVWTHPDERQYRELMQYDLWKRAWGDKIDIIFLSGSNGANEKSACNDPFYGTLGGYAEGAIFKYTPTRNILGRLTLVDAIFIAAQSNPTFYSTPTPLQPAFVNDPYRLLLYGKDGELLSRSGCKVIAGDFDLEERRLLHLDNYLVTKMFPGNFNIKDSSGYPPVSVQNSIVPGLTAQRGANGYCYGVDVKNSHCNSCANTLGIFVIGEIKEIDTVNHKVTIKRDDYNENQYPYRKLYAKYVKSTDELVNMYNEIMNNFTKNNTDAGRMMTFNINVGVELFLNGVQLADIKSFKKGDVVSVGYRKGFQYPLNIRALRYNFAPVIDQVTDKYIKANSNTTTVQLKGISDNNLVCAQGISITAKSLNKNLIGTVLVNYKNGDSTATLSFKPISDSIGYADIRVCVKDSGGVEFGGADSTILIFKVTVAPAAGLPPTINPVGNIEVNENSGKTTVKLSGISDGDGGKAISSITASSVSAIISNLLVNYTPGKDTASLSFLAVADSFGVAKIEITVEDSTGLIKTISFNVTIKEKKEPLSLGSRNAVKIYPNPASDYLNIDVPEGMYHSYMIYHITGRVVEFKGLPSAHYTLTVSDYPKGTYIISLFGKEGIDRYKFVVE